MPGAFNSFNRDIKYKLREIANLSGFDKDEIVVNYFEVNPNSFKDALNYANLSKEATEEIMNILDDLLKNGETIRFLTAKTKREIESNKDSYRKSRSEKSKADKKPLLNLKKLTQQSDSSQGEVLEAVNSFGYMMVDFIKMHTYPKMKETYFNPLWIKCFSLSGDKENTYTNLYMVSDKCYAIAETPEEISRMLKESRGGNI